jgi:hypothetical protein
MPIIGTFIPLLTSLLMLSTGSIIRTPLLSRLVVMTLVVTLGANLTFLPYFIDGYSFVATIGS